jgi:hypothetical protein
VLDYLLELKDNYKFVLVVLLNSLAFIMALIWAYYEGGANNLEPYVTSLGSLGVISGLFYVNNRLTRPRVKVSMSGGFVSNDPTSVFILDVVNHSINKVYIKNLNFLLGNGKKAVYQHDKHHKSIMNFTLEAGQSESFIFNMSDFFQYVEDINSKKIALFFSDSLNNKFYLSKKSLKIALEAADQKKAT